MTKTSLTRVRGILSQPAHPELVNAIRGQLDVYRQAAIHKIITSFCDAIDDLLNENPTLHQINDLIADYWDQIERCFRHGSWMHSTFPDKMRRMAFEAVLMQRRAMKDKKNTPASEPFDAGVSIIAE